MNKQYNNENESRVSSVNTFPFERMKSKNNNNGNNIRKKYHVIRLKENKKKMRKTFVEDKEKRKTKLKKITR